MDRHSVMSGAPIPAHPLVWLLPDGGPQARPDPWLARWAEDPAHAWLEQHDLRRPLRGDWSVRLQETLIDASAPVVLAASGLGCILTAWWAAHAPAVARTKVRGALLLDPTNTELPALRQQLPGWIPIARQRLPFASVVVDRARSTAGCVSHAQTLAEAWGAAFVPLDVTDETGAQALLHNLLKDSMPW